MSKPKLPWSILDSTHPYVPAIHTNVAATFARIRAEMKQSKPAEVVQIIRKREKQ